jgi:PadR family transcriptional regulator PadR
MKLSKDLMAASTVTFVLSILEEGESYGYAIIQRVRELSRGEIEWTDGMLYPVLHWLEENRYVQTRIRPRPAENENTIRSGPTDESTS